MIWMWIMWCLCSEHLAAESTYLCKDLECSDTHLFNIT